MPKHVLIYGFSVFSMFFGSGNLVFPLQVGVQSGVDWVAGFMGLFLTGIILPFFGLFAVKLHKGDYNAFFGEAGYLAKIVLPFFALSLLGSFGVVPRCIIVAYSGIEHMMSDIISLKAFSSVFCIVCWICCLNDRRMISILGKWLTPILLIPLIILIICGALRSPDIINNTVGTQNFVSSFINGFTKGYETMDLFAAFFFSSLIFSQIQHLIHKDSNSKEITRFALKANLIGAGLLSIIYLGFVYLGAYYNHLLVNIAPELYLPEITSYLFGQKASLIIGIIILLSCLTTAVALNNIYARYLCGLLKVNETKFSVVLAVTTSLSFIVSMSDFRGITNFLLPLLQISYPSLIVLTFLSITFKNYSKFKVIAFYGIIALTFIYIYMVKL